jgi:polyketide biosynthesis enoyl-CoA hydratase PksH
MADPSTAVSITREPGYLQVRLTRPETGNQLDSALVDGITSAVAAAEAASEAAERDEPIVIVAQGPAFCSGMRLDTGRLPADWAGHDLLPPWRLFATLARCRVPTIAVIDGTVTAGGVGVAAACDLVACGDRARWRLTESVLGLVPAMVLPFLVRRVGQQRAFGWAMTAAEIGPSEAIATGLADLHAPTAADALRKVLVALRRLPAGTCAVLKSYRDEVFPLTDALGARAGTVLTERLSAPAVQRRLGRLREEGLLP